MDTYIILKYENGKEMHGIRNGAEGEHEMRLSGKEKINFIANLNKACYYCSN